VLSVPITTKVVSSNTVHDDTTLCDKVYQWLATGRWFSPGSLVSSTNKTDRHDITEILLKVALNTLSPSPPLLIWNPGSAHVSYVVLEFYYLNDLNFASDFIKQLLEWTEKGSKASKFTVIHFIVGIFYYQLYLLGPFNCICLFVWWCCTEGPLWSWSYGRCVYNYLCNQCLSQLWVRTLFMVGEGFQRRRLKCEKLTDDGRQVMAKVHIAFGKVS
jgi:hypothetical protein